MQQTVIETIQFQLKPEASAQDYMQANQLASPAMQADPGLINRIVSRGEDEVWTILLLWKDKAAAEAGGARFSEAPYAQSLRQLIAQESFSMRQETVMAVLSDIEVAHAQTRAGLSA